MASDSFFDFRARMVQRRPAPAETPPAKSEAGAGGVDAMSVSQLTRQIDRVLKAGFPMPVLVKGELSSFKLHGPSGNAYLTLKDASSCIDGVMWRDSVAKLGFEPVAGTEVLVTGRVSVYVERGKYQLYVTELRPLGQGALELAFRQLCQKLQAEGLFEAQRKRPIPAYPRRIVMVTSRQTAAVQDMLKVLRRYPWVRLGVYHVPVQGESAGREIAAAVRHLSDLASDQTDVILLGRGGGSLEDLWCFNDETLARAIAASRIPIVTGIGHEVDTSIADLVADYHAHTPTEAAQVVVQHWRQAPVVVNESTRRLFRCASQDVDGLRNRLRHAGNHEFFRRPVSSILSFRQRLDDLDKDLSLRVSGRLRALHARVGGASERVARLHPAFALARWRERLADAERRLGDAVHGRLTARSAVVAALSGRLTEAHPRHRVTLASQRLAELECRLTRAVNDGLRRRTDRLEAIAGQLFVVGPDRVLRRGFTLTIRMKDRRIIRSASEIVPGDRMITRFSDGEVEWTAEDPKQPGLFQ